MDDIEWSYSTCTYGRYLRTSTQRTFPHWDYTVPIRVDYTPIERSFVTMTLYWGSYYLLPDLFVKNLVPYGYPIIHQLRMQVYSTQSPHSVHPELAERCIELLVSITPTWRNLQLKSTGTITCLHKSTLKYQSADILITHWNWSMGIQVELVPPSNNHKACVG